jgi:predicted DCC family thiol-disulfide oxidoreductase YuxK
MTSTHATDPARTDPPPDPRYLVLYDGVCGLCDHSVQFLLRVDRRRVLMFTPLQGETAAALRARHPEIPADLDTVVYIEDGRVHLRSRAFVRLARQLPYPWRALSWLWVVPRPLADLVYRLVARVRYRLFGKFDTCRVPSPDERARFLP